MPVATTILLITAATDLRLCYSRLERVRTSLRNSDCDAKFTGRHRTLAEYGRPLSARDEVTKWESQLNMMVGRYSPPVGSDSVLVKFRRRLGEPSI